MLTQPPNARFNVRESQCSCTGVCSALPGGNSTHVPRSCCCADFKGRLEDDDLVEEVGVEYCLLRAAILLLSWWKLEVRRKIEIRAKMIHCFVGL